MSAEPWRPDMYGADLIRCERARQQVAEGFSRRFDDRHERGEITRAAMAYAQEAYMQASGHDSSLAWALWPMSWQRPGWKPSPDPIRNLTKAGALIAAEIDRLQRKATRGDGLPESGRPPAQAGQPKEADMPAVQMDEKYYVEWDTEDFREKCSLACIEQGDLNKAMGAGLLEAIHRDGKWFYGLQGLNHNFPLPEGKGWQD